jgi:hypothetical protein
MADENKELVSEPDLDIYTYPPAVPCLECGGSGKIVLFVVPRACDACGGTGKVLPEAKHEHVPGKLGYVRCERTFDDQGRLIVESRWFEPVADAGTGPASAGQGGSGEQGRPKA